MSSTRLARVAPLTSEQLVPTAFASLSNPCLPDLLIEDYPAMPGVIMLFSLFCLFALEMYLKAKVGGHSHGGPTGQEISAPMPAHQHAHGRARVVRSNPVGTLPPYDIQGSSGYPSSYEEKLFARYDSWSLNKVKC